MVTAVAQFEPVSKSALSAGAKEIKSHEAARGNDIDSQPKAPAFVQLDPKVMKNAMETVSKVIATKLGIEPPSKDKEQQKGAQVSSTTKSIVGSHTASLTSQSSQPKGQTR